MAEITLPSSAFEPYVPDASNPWDLRKVGHLYRRAGFGLPWNAIHQKATLSPGQCADELLNYDPNVDPFAELYEQVEGLVLFSRAETAQAWWFHRMVNTPNPMQEKVALFWHNRFATSLAKVDRPEWMHQQIELFRRKGLGSFRELLLEVTRDPAMLVWLDGRESHRGKPNENYAREIMELFTLGPGNYQEADIKELARAFTGWRIDYGSSSSMMSMAMTGPTVARGVLDPKQWDDGPKTIFGKTGKFGATEAIDLILAQPGAPRFLATKMLKEFVCPEPPKQAVDHYAARLLANKWEIKPVLREMFLSKWFYSDDVYRSKIKSPVELCVGAALALGGKVNDTFLRDSAAKMGQTLLYPPNVKGWDGQEAWINANTVLVRFNYGMRLASQRQDEFAKRSDFQGWLTRANVRDANDVLNYYATTLLDANIPVADRTEMLDFLNKGTKNEPKPFALTPETISTKVRGLVHLLMSTPEYQLA
jgi:uncharacterized protein (DUF1800 family)